MLSIKDWLKDGHQTKLYRPLFVIVTKTLKERNEMSARIGDLAIARFDSKDKGKRWNECICFVTGRNKSLMEFIYWEGRGNYADMDRASLPKGRVIRAVPKVGSEHIILNGGIAKLTIDDIEPYDEQKERTKSQDVRLGGCYHNGVAYCLGYRISSTEIELGDKIFTNINTGVGSRADSALEEHRSNFCPHEDIPRFIVALKPVEIINESESQDAKRDCDDEEDCSFCGESGCDFDCLENNYCETCGGTCQLVR